MTNVLPGSVNTPLFDDARTKIGVKPMPIPPIYQPGTVADVILHAAENPARDLVAGGAASQLDELLEDASPGRHGLSTARGHAGSHPRARGLPVLAS